MFLRPQSGSFGNGLLHREDKVKNKLIGRSSARLAAMEAQIDSGLTRSILAATHLRTNFCFA